MFTALFSIFKAEPQNDIILDKANEALHDRMIHMLRHPHIAPRYAPRETYSTPLVKNRVSIRKAIAA
jgi:hypothetical protein